MNRDGGPAGGRGLNLLCALASGLLSALAQPLAIPGSNEQLLPAGAETLALVALLPLLVRLRGAKPRSWLGWGTVAGAVHFGVTLYWLEVALTTFGRLPVLAAWPIMGLLVAFLALFWGLALALAELLDRRVGFSAWWGLPCCWTALEWLRNYLFSGFPWASLGGSQIRSLWLAQAASLGGVYLVGWLVVWSNSALAHLLLWRSGRERLRRGLVAGWVAAMALAALFGSWRLGGEATGTRLTVGLVQGNLDERAHLRGGAAQRWVWRRLARASAAAAARGARLVVWPEASLPDPLWDGDERAIPPGEVAGGLPPRLVLGAVLRTAAPGRRHLRNSALLVDETGRILARYHKRHLVPFGEYVPLGDYLPLHWFLPPGVAFFLPGADHAPLRAGVANLGVLICYEAIFPEIARQTVSQGAQLLVNITNDSWYGRTSAPHQHLALSRWRAIETGRWLVRAANTGISAVVDSRGRVRARSPLGLARPDGDFVSPGQLQPPDWLVWRVPLLEGQTVYLVLGDWCPAASSLVVLLGLGLVAWRRRFRPAQ